MTEATYHKWTFPMGDDPEIEQVLYVPDSSVEGGLRRVGTVVEFTVSGFGPMFEGGAPTPTAEQKEAS